MDKKCAAIINDHDFEKIELSLKEPNIFRALSIERNELKHSNFLSYILDPRENHGLKDIVLKKFLRDIFSASSNVVRTLFDADYIDMQCIEIRREWRNIDILIILKDDIVLIENKVDSVDHSRQLMRYHGIVEDTFPDKVKHYVYLTPDGSSPQDEEARDIYIDYSYAQILNIIDSILLLYKNSISQKVLFYLSDYVISVKRELLMNDELNKIALRVYNAHKEAFDFIFDNKPDPANLLYPYFKEIIEENGFIIGSKNKGTVKFTTNELAALLPAVGEGWPDKEVFLFELDYFWYKDTAVFKAMGAPCDPDIQNALHEAAQQSKFYKKPGGKKWLTFHMKKFPFVASEVVNDGEAEIRKKIAGMIEDIKPAASEISETIAKNFVNPKVGVASIAGR